MPHHNDRMAQNPVSVGARSARTRKKKGRHKIPIEELGNSCLGRRFDFEEIDDSHQCNREWAR